MPGDFLSVGLNTDAWDKAKTHGMQFLGDMSPFFQVAGQHQVRSVKRTLRESGHPAGSFAPLSPATGRTGKPLMATGQTIMGGIFVKEVTPHQVTIASGFEYSHVHQYGMTIKPRSQYAQIYGMHAPMLYWFAGGKWHAAKSVTIPARPFMVFRTEDPEWLDNMAAKMLGEAFKGKV